MFGLADGQITSACVQLRALYYAGRGVRPLTGLPWDTGEPVASAQW